jgi:hypothetical protein
MGKLAGSTLRVPRAQKLARVRRMLVRSPHSDALALAVSAGDDAMVAHYDLLSGAKGASVVAAPIARIRADLARTQVEARPNRAPSAALCPGHLLFVLQVELAELKTKTKVQVGSNIQMVFSKGLWCGVVHEVKDTKFKARWPGNASYNNTSYPVKGCGLGS